MSTLNFFNQFPPFSFLILFLWSYFWKGVALWRTVEEKQKYWFMAILILNTVGVLELVYLFKFAKKKLTFTEMKSWVFKKRE